MNPAPSDDRALRAGLAEPVVDLIHVLEIAQGEVSLAVDAGDRRHEGLGANREDEVVVGLRILPLRLVLDDSDRLGIAVDRENLGQGADIEVQAGLEGCRCLYIELGAVLDLAAEVIRHSTVCEARVRALLEHDD